MTPNLPAILDAARRWYAALDRDDAAGHDDAYAAETDLKRLLHGVALPVGHVEPWDTENLALRMLDEAVKAYRGECREWLATAVWMLTLPRRREAA